MKNVTITVDEDVARWARIEAARRGTSVSRLLGGFLKEKMARQDAYEEARRSFLAVQPRPLNEGVSRPTREELHDRQGLR